MTTSSPRRRRLQPEREHRPPPPGPPDPLPDAVSEAMRTATVALWRDLAERAGVTPAGVTIDALRAENRALRAEVARLRENRLPAPEPGAGATPWAEALRRARRA